MRLTFIRLSLVAVVFAALTAAFAGAQEMEKFNVPASSGITLGPDGAMWFAYGDAAIGRMDTNGNVTNIYNLPFGKGAPGGITTGSDGNLWFTTQVTSGVGRITPTGIITMFSVPPGSLPYAITSGPDGNLWFTMPGINRIGRMTTSGVLTDFPVPTPLSGLAGIASGPDGNLWFAESLASRIGRITTSGDFAEWGVGFGSRPMGITAGPDGNMWFTEQFATKVGRITTAGAITEFPAPPFATGIVSAYGALWLARPGEVTQVTTNGVTTSYTALIFSPPTVGIATDSEGRIYITDNINGFSGQILRVTDTTPDQCVADDTTLCLNNGRFRVRSAFRTAGGPVQDAHAVGLTADTGYFWFFNAANIELIAKVLNGCGVNGHYWNFLAGLTNVEVTTTVTDTFTGTSKVYTNPAGTPFAPVQDTAAFAACP